MDGKGMRLLAGAGLLLGLAVSTGRAEEPLWRPVTAAPPAAHAPASPGPAASLGRPEPLATLGRPVPVGQPADAVDPPFIAGAAASPATFSSANAPAVIRCEAPGDVQPVQLSGPPPVPPPPPPPSGAYGGEPYNAGVAIDHPLNKTFGDRCGEFFGFNGGGANSSCNRGPFQSDHAFDCLISPVSNPFHFEDPRSLTEIKPLFIYQVSPKNNPVFAGGGSEFYGLQGRLALNENWSVVINKLGFVSMQPKNTNDEFTKATGFAEFNIGPKWTFYRNEQTGGIAATGLNFEIPTGAKKVFQNTGTLGLDPYITFARSFGRLPNGYGMFNVMGELGYNFAVDNKQTEFLHASLHLDYDVANLHKIYPLIELNYYHYTDAGKDRPLGFEGLDLINFGSTGVSGRDYLSMAVGGRYKFSENFQTGLAFEFPLTSPHDLLDYRVNLDVIFRW